MRTGISRAGAILLVLLMVSSTGAIASAQQGRPDGVPPEVTPPENPPGIPGEVPPEEPPHPYCRWGYYDNDTTICRDDLVDWFPGSRCQTVEGSIWGGIVICQHEELGRVSCNIDWPDCYPRPG